jgi:hypothetical protein
MLRVSIPTRFILSLPLSDCSGLPTTRGSTNVVNAAHHLGTSWVFCVLVDRGECPV